MKHDYMKTVTMNAIICGAAILAIISLTGCGAKGGLEARFGYYRSDTHEEKSQAFEKSVACQLYDGWCPKEK